MLPNETPIWTVLFQGFTQSEVRHTGMEKLWTKLGDFRCDLASREMRDWNSRVDPLAERIWRLSEEMSDVTPRVIVAGYSYGGTTALNFCRSLAKRGIRVEMLYLIDPVWRPLRHLPSATSAFRFWRLRVPSNVDKCRVYHQENNTPRGHRAVADDPKATEMLPPILRNRNHEYMDDDIGFQTAFYSTVRGVVQSEQLKRIA